MARPLSPRKILEEIISRLEEELSDPSTTKARRHAVDRQLLQAALGLVRLQKLRDEKKLQDQKKAAAEEHEHRAEPEPLIPSLLGSPTKKVEEYRAEPKPLLSKLLGREYVQWTTDNESPSGQSNDAATATAAPAGSSPDDPQDEDSDTEAEDSDIEDDEDPNTGTEDPDPEPDEPVRKTDDEPETICDLKTALERRVRGLPVHEHPLICFLPMPGELPPPAPQQPAPRLSWWVGGPGCPEPQKPIVVDNSDWDGNRIQDPRYEVRQAEPVHMDSPKRKLHQFLADVVAGKDTGE